MTKSNYPGDAIAPSNLEAERFIIGACLKRQENIKTAAVALHATDFYDQRHQAIFNAAITLKENGAIVDIATVREQASKGGIQIERGFIEAILREVPIVSSIDSHIDIVREKALSRKLLVAMNNSADAIHFQNKGDTEEILNETIKTLEDIRKTARNATSTAQSTQDLLKDRMNAVYERYETGELKGIYKTGIKTYDDEYVGIEKQEIVIVAGRPGMGKTSFAMNLMTNISKAEKLPSPIFTLEMPGEQLMERMIASESGVHAKKIKSGNLSKADLIQINKASAKISQTELLIDSTPGLTPSLMRRKLMEFQDKHGELGPVMLDYVQIMKPDKASGNDVSDLSSIVKELKRITGEFDVPLILLSQLNRDVEKRQIQRMDAKPMASDLKGAGDLEQAGNTIICVHRPYELKKIHPQLENDALKTYAELVFVKTRGGESKTLPVEFIGENTLFRDGNPETLLEQRELFESIASNNKNSGNRFSPGN